MSHLHLRSPVRKEFEGDERVKVTIAGLEELNSTRGFVYRLFWAFVLLAMAGLAIRDFVTLTIHNLHSGTSTDLQLKFGQQSFELPSLIVCVQSTYNVSKLMETLVVPAEARRRIKKLNWTMEEVFREFSQFLMQNNFHQPNYSIPLQRIFWLLLAEESNSDIVNDAKYLIEHYLPSCQQVVASCSFAQKPNDCCSKSVISFSDASVCYKFDVNPEDKDVFAQTLPGPDGGLSVDILTDTTSSFFTDGITSDGLYVYTQYAPGPFGLPVAITSDTHLYLRLIPKRRILLNNCRDHPTKMKYLDYYDPDGKACFLDTVITGLQPMLNCFMQLPPAFPNTSESCSVVYASNILSLFNQGQDTSIFLNTGGTSHNAMELKARELMKSSGISLDNFQLNQINKFTPECKPLCASWQYDTIASFGSLVDNDTENHIDNRTYFRNRISLYYGDFDYRIETEIPTTSSDVLFAQIGSIIGLYGGASVITMVQVVIYGAGKSSRFIYSALIQSGYRRWQRRRLTIVELF